jgi:multimeric flavodoxin WrbA
MNMVILNGGPADGSGALHRRIREIAEEEGRSRGFAITAFDLAGLDVKPCRGCFACWLKHPGTCAIKDEQERVLKAMSSADIEVWITPLTFGGYSSVLKKSLDRLIPNILPFFIKVRGEVHHPPRYERRSRLVALGTVPSPDADAAAIFRGLVERNAINFHSIEARVEVLPETMEDAELATAVRAQFENMEAPS